MDFASHSMNMIPVGPVRSTLTLHRWNKCCEPWWFWHRFHQCLVDLWWLVKCLMIDECFDHGFDPWLLMIDEVVAAWAAWTAEITFIAGDLDWLGQGVKLVLKLLCYFFAYSIALNALMLSLLKNRARLATWTTWARWSWLLLSDITRIIHRCQVL